MLPFYNFFILLLAPFLSLYLLLFLWRRKEYRAAFPERLGLFPSAQTDRGTEPPVSDEPCFWIHAVSVGEVMAAVPMVKRLKARWPQCRVIFSTHTPAGRAMVHAKCPEVNRVVYFPLDVLPIVAAVIRRFRPSLFVLVETDIWPTWLYGLAREKIPAVMVNGRISPRRLWLGPFYRDVLSRFTFLCMQTEVDAERIIRLGIEPANVFVTGNMKFALTDLREEDPENLRAAIGFPKGARLLIAGSTHPGEEKEILRCYERLRRQDGELFLLIAPRHPERVGEVEKLFRAQGLSCVRRSQVDGSKEHAVVLLDTIGELARAYALGTFIFVGGSFVRRGGHNVMEPASWGKPLFFGPYMEHYSGIADALEREGAAVRVHNGTELAQAIERLSKNPVRQRAMGQKAASFVARNQGALEKNLEVIEKILGGRP